MLNNSLDIPNKFIPTDVCAHTRGRKSQAEKGQHISLPYHHLEDFAFSSVCTHNVIPLEMFEYIYDWVSISPANPSQRLRQQEVALKRGVLLMEINRNNKVRIAKGKCGSS
jgi:hypothetical protein